MCVTPSCTGNMSDINVGVIPYKRKQGLSPLYYQNAMAACHYGPIYNSWYIHCNASFSAVSFLYRFDNRFSFLLYISCLVAAKGGKLCSLAF
jgi:hypothetical protein